MKARAIIAATMAGAPAELMQDEPALLKLIDAAYPFGQRAMHPYKCWLKERAAVRARLFPKEPKPVPYETIGDGPLFSTTTSPTRGGGEK